MLTPLSGNAQRWINALGSGNIKISAHVNILRSGIVIADLPIETGSITLDRTAAIRRTCNLTLTPEDSRTLDPSWMQTFEASGNEMRPWWQITYSDGTTDEVSLGTFTIVESLITDSGTDLTVKITGYDRSWIMQQNKLLKPYLVQPGITVDAAIQKLISDNWTGSPLNFNIQPQSEVIPGTGALVRAGKSVWSEALLLSASIGYELFMDPYGTVTGMPVPTPSAQAPVMTLTTYQASGLKWASVKSTRKGVYSAFGLIGEGSKATLNKAGTKLTMKKIPIYASSYDTDPNSATYYLGPFGTVGNSKRSTVVSSQTQGQAVTDGELRNQRGAMTGLDITTLPIPLLDAYDVVAIVAQRLGINGNYVVDGWTATIHFDASMQVVVRQVI